MTAKKDSFLAFDELFARIGVLGHEFSARLAELSGQEVTMRGHLAPVRHHGDAHDAGHDDDGVLVLTQDPVAPCSDCGGGHDWPDSAVFVFPAHSAAFTQGLVSVRGILEHGPLRVGDVNSLVRLRDARWSE
ncbi:MAG: hypothetical protein QM682_00720 [Paracoccus sp. (in: a-proteobacteria)]|uniref:hypothetical protein n=1 Tax=Paracoccus sp. TaxID=267 RepID=UPI0039E3BBFF